MCLCVKVGDVRATMFYKDCKWKTSIHILWPQPSPRLHGSVGVHSRIPEIEKWHTRRDPAQAWEVHACCSISYCMYAPIRLVLALEQLSVHSNT
jgi:hypothetical protein